MKEYKYTVTYVCDKRIINLKAYTLIRALRYKYLLKSMGFDSLVVKR